jgi:hypothetical protein
MPRLFLGNFEFEHRLADPSRQISRNLERINAELALSWLAIAEDGDLIWTPQKIESDFFDRLKHDGLPTVIPVTSLESVPTAVECVPWGWTDEIRRLCDVRGWLRNDPTNTAVQATNSRRFSCELEHEWQVGLAGAGPVGSLDDVKQRIDHLCPTSRWVIKAEFGMSGRERILGSGIPIDSQSRWIQKRVHDDGILFFEPWVDRIAEVGIQIEIPQTGSPVLLGVVPLLSDERGQYSGSEFAPKETEAIMATWGEALLIALQAASRAQQLGYFGPMGIDAMQYRDHEGVTRIRPLQDINARWTMGRLSLGWRRFLKAGESGFWRFGNVAPVDSVIDRVIPVSYTHLTLPTSP